MRSDGPYKVRRNAAVWREVDGETVVLDLASASYLGINETGSMLWAALVNGAEHDRLVDLLITNFGVDPERASSDVDHFVEVCRSRGLIE